MACYFPEPRDAQEPAGKISQKKSFLPGFKMPISICVQIFGVQLQESASPRVGVNICA